MRPRSLIVVLSFVCPAVYCQNLPQPLTQVEACRKFKSTIVGVSSGKMNGTGFIVGSDGWIVTALHVVADRKTLIKHGSVQVSIPGRSQVDAEVVSLIDELASARDFAILKVAKSDLTALELGSESDAEDGSPVAIIGFPLSAYGIPIPIPPFCLSGTVTAQTSLPLGNLQYLHTVYFQGVSIKGISGAPIVSLITGKVIGIASTKLTGIGPALEATREMLSSGSGFVQAGGFNSTYTTNAIIDTLDDQLANGLGSGTGADDVVAALAKAKRTYEKEHTHQK